jgi:hypothetical protein
MLRLQIATRLFAVLTICVYAPPIQACGYEDPYSASFQRGALNRSYANALYVQGALTRAYFSRVLEPAAPVLKDPFGARFRRTSDILRRFGVELRPGNADEFAFTLVLIEPMLWTRYTVSGGSVTTSVHVKAPEKGDLVIVSAEASPSLSTRRRTRAGSLLWQFGNVNAAARSDPAGGRCSMRRTRPRTDHRLCVQILSS